MPPVLHSGMGVASAAAPGVVPSAPQEQAAAARIPGRAAAQTRRPVSQAHRIRRQYPPGRQVPPPLPPYSAALRPRHRHRNRSRRLLRRTAPAGGSGSERSICAGVSASGSVILGAAAGEAARCGEGTAAAIAGAGRRGAAAASSSAMICRMDERISSIEGSFGAGLFMNASVSLKARPTGRHLIRQRAL